MSKVIRSLICRGCVNPVTSTDHTRVDIVISANLELVDKFCYLGDVLSVDGDDDATVEARIQIGWNKFRKMVPLLTSNIIASESHQINQATGYASQHIWYLSQARINWEGCVRKGILHKNGGDGRGGGTN